jgi:hypothetical protein
VIADYIKRKEANREEKKERKKRGRKPAVKPEDVANAAN